MLSTQGCSFGVLGESIKTIYVTLLHCFDFEQCLFVTHRSEYLSILDRWTFLSQCCYMKSLNIIYWSTLALSKSRLEDAVHDF